MRSVATAASIAAAVFGLAASAAWGAAVTPGWECIPTTQGQAVVSGGTGSAPACGSGTTAVLAPTYVSSGVGGKPTVEFSAVNVQIVSGSGSTSGAVNGEGNLVIGYAENANGYSQAGSHDLIVGSNNGWKGYGELVGGDKNQSIGNFAAAFGQGNKASGTASLAAGSGNVASGSQSSAIGGEHNTAKGAQSSVTGGDFNLANDLFASVDGGCENVAGPSASISATCLNGAQAVLGGFGTPLPGSSRPSAAARSASPPAGAPRSLAASSTVPAVAARRSPAAMRTPPAGTSRRSSGASSTASRRAARRSLRPLETVSAIDCRNAGPRVLMRAGVAVPEG